MQSALAGPAAPKLGMASSDKTRKLKRQRNDQDDGPGTKRLSFTRLFVFPIFCGHDPLLCPGVDHDSGRNVRLPSVGKITLGKGIRVSA